MLPKYTLTINEFNKLSGIGVFHKCIYNPFSSTKFFISSNLILLQWVLTQVSPALLH